jgi:toxin FitB
VIGWLLDTNVVSELVNPNGARRVKDWAASQDEARVFLSVLTLAEYDKGIHNVADDHPSRPRFIAMRDGIAARFAGRTLSVSDAVIRRWGAVSGAVKRQTGQAPPVIDTMLATTALEHDLYFATRNVRDVRASGAAVFNPWEDDPAGFPLSPAPRRL